MHVKEYVCSEEFFGDYCVSFLVPTLVVSLTVTANGQNSADIIHMYAYMVPFLLLAGLLRAPRRGLPRGRAEQPSDPLPPLGGVGQVVQVPAARPHQRVLRREDRHLLCLAGYVLIVLDANTN